MAEGEIILGIDPGFGRTGYGVIMSGKQPRVIDYGVIETSKDTPYDQRLVTIFNGLQTIIQHHKPAAIGIEELFFCNNVTTAIKVGQARGVAILAAAQANTPIHELNPMQIKQAISGYGKAKKQDMQKMVQLLLNLSTAPTPDDAADALAIALATAQLKKSSYA